MSTTIRTAWLGLPVALLMIAGCGGKPAEQATEAPKATVKRVRKVAGAAAEGEKKGD